MTEQTFDNLIKLLNEHADKGNERVENTNLDQAKARLDYVLKNNSDVEPARICVVPEHADIFHVIGKATYCMSFKSARQLTLAAICFASVPIGGNFFADVLAYNNMHEYVCAIPIYLSYLSLGLAAVCEAAGIVCLNDGIKEYSRFKHSPFFIPLSRRERLLANYVFMKEHRIVLTEDNH